MDMKAKMTVTDFLEKFSHVKEIKEKVDKAVENINEIFERHEVELSDCELNAAFGKFKDGNELLKIVTAELERNTSLAHHYLDKELSYGYNEIALDNEVKCFTWPTKLGYELSKVRFIANTHTAVSHSHGSLKVQVGFRLKIGNSSNNYDETKVMELLELVDAYRKLRENNKFIFEQYSTCEYIAENCPDAVVTLIEDDFISLQCVEKLNKAIETVNHELMVREVF